MQCQCNVYALRKLVYDSTYSEACVLHLSNNLIALLYIAVLYGVQFSLLCYDGSCIWWVLCSVFFRVVRFLEFSICVQHSFWVCSFPNFFCMLKMILSSLSNSNDIKKSQKLLRFFLLALFISLEWFIKCNARISLDECGQHKEQNINRGNEHWFIFNWIEWRKWRYELCLSSISINANEYESIWSDVSFFFDGCEFKCVCVCVDNRWLDFVAWSINMQSRRLRIIYTCLIPVSRFLSCISNAKMVKWKSTNTMFNIVCEIVENELLWNCKIVKVLCVCLLFF